MIWKAKKVGTTNYVNIILRRMLDLPATNFSAQTLALLRFFEPGRSLLTARYHKLFDTHQGKQWLNQEINQELK